LRGGTRGWQTWLRWGRGKGVQGNQFRQLTITEWLLLQICNRTASASPVVIPVVDEPRKSPEPRGVGLSIGPLMLKQMEVELVEEANNTQKTVRQETFCTTPLARLERWGKQSKGSRMSV